MDGGDDERAAAALTTRSTALLPSSAELTTRFSLYGIGPPHPLDISSAGVAACRCERCEQWDAFVATGSCGQPMYLVPTSDLVERFARWLLCERDAGASRVLELGGSAQTYGLLTGAMGSLQLAAGQLTSASPLAPMRCGPPSTFPGAGRTMDRCLEEQANVTPLSSP